MMVLVYLMNNDAMEKEIARIMKMKKIVQVDFSNYLIFVTKKESTKFSAKKAN